MGQTKLENKIDYQALEQQRTDALQAQLKQELKSREAGRFQSMGRAVLRSVVEGQYKEASRLIDGYIEDKTSYPRLQERANAHVNHAKDLINAIRAKRNFPNLSQLSMSKQQEILDHAIGHFDELKFTIKTIEHMVKEEVIIDIRSTVWVVRSLVYVVVALVVTSFVLDFSGSLARPIWVVFNDFVDMAFKTLLKFIPFL